MNRIYKTGRENPRFINRIGETHITDEKYEITVIEHYDKYNCTIQFEDGIILKNISYGSIKKGKVKHPHSPTVYGVGYMGVGKYTKWKNGKETKEYTKWKGMLRRFRDKKYLQKHITYREVTADKSWYNFQNFAEWFEENWKDHMDSSWHLDKDILFKGNKIYSPETCCFVPQEINLVLVKSDKCRGLYPIGVSKVKGGFLAKHKKHLEILKTPEEAFEVYKVDKEIEIKRMADEWRGQITEPCYHALYNYTVEITD